MSKLSHPVRMALRHSVQVLSIAAFFLLLHQMRYPVTGRIPLGIYFRADAFLALITTLFSLAPSTYFLPAAIISVLIVFRGNFFCFLLCPLGCAADLENRLFLRRKMHFLRFFHQVKLHPIRFILLWLAAASAILHLAVPGTPFLAWVLDPFVVIHNAAIFRSGWLIYLIVILIISFLIPRVWCNNICPLGAINYLLGISLRHRLTHLWRDHHGRPHDSSRLS